MLRQSLVRHRDTGKRSKIRLTWTLDKEYVHPDDGLVVVEEAKIKPQLLLQ
jgi:hypothetical protein